MKSYQIGNSFAKVMSRSSYKYIKQGCFGTNFLFINSLKSKVSNIRRTQVGNKIVDHSDVVGASPVGAAPTTSSFST